tara:strand:+ start:646 stop:1020 length:375 start_codon:yes stop_codon:yes gene_type:complete
MAVSLANVTHPNQNTWEGEFLGQKCKVMDVTFDASYDNTNGEVVTAGQLGYQNIYGAFPMSQAWSGTSTDFAAVVVPVVNSARTSVALRCFQANGAAAAKESLNEVANAVDLSTYSVRMVFIGA